MESGSSNCDSPNPKDWKENGTAKDNMILSCFGLISKKNI